MKEMSKKSENSDNGVLNGSTDSPSVDNDSNNNRVLRKGPWTSEEDDILMDYVRKHGEGNWNAVQKHSGLARCGKSCRLRWTNHLRPDLKKGAFSLEEERLVVELHAKMGNKWSRMAPELPGRTDNEIKNFWNTRIKRRRKAGLPIYPPDICPQVQNENQQGDEVDSCFPENVYHPPVTSIEIPPVEFKNLDQNRYASILGDISTINLPEIPAGSIMVQGFQTSYSLTGSYSTNALAKELCGSEMFFTYGNQSSTDGFLRCAPSLGFSSPYDHCSGFLTSTPSSQPSCAMKLELSSFQNQMGSWGSPWPSSSSFPVFEDASIQTENMCTLPSLNNNDLLDAAPYASTTVTKSKNCSFPWDILASKMAATYSNQGLYAGFEYDEHFSPLGHSSSFVFCDSPLVSCNTLDELQSIDELIPVKEETGNADRVLGNEKINSECVHPVKQLMNGYSLETLDKSKKMDAGAASQAQLHSQDLCAWNASASGLLCHINSTEARIRTEIEQFFAVPAAWDDNEL